MIVCMKSEPVLVTIEGVCMVVLLIILFLAPKDALRHIREANIHTYRQITEHIWNALLILVIQ